MSKFPCFSSKELVRLVEQGGAVFVGQGASDHAIYARTVEGRRYSAPGSNREEDLGSDLLQKAFQTIEIFRSGN